MEKKIKCSELPKDSKVLFRVDPYYQGNKSIYQGFAIIIYDHMPKICVSYLEGYKSRVDDIPYEDMIAVYDKDGPKQDIEGWKGNGYYLIPE